MVHPSEPQTLTRTPVCWASGGRIDTIKSDARAVREGGQGHRGSVEGLGSWQSLRHKRPR